MNDRRERRSLEEVPPDIVARIRRDFGADEVGRILPLLEDLRSDRLERCALFLAEGSMPRLKSAIKLGHEEYRDLILAAQV